jgi:hypothetical protein
MTSNIENKDCILYLLSKTLKCLLKHLPSNQDKAGSVMKGEAVMPSPVNGIQQQEQCTQTDLQDILDGRENIPSPCTCSNLWLDGPLDRK